MADSKESKALSEGCPIEEYESVLERIFGVYLDATEGFRHIADTSHIFFDKKVVSNVSDQWKEAVSSRTAFPLSAPKVRNEKGESPAGYLIFTLGSQETGDYMELSARTAVEVILANREDGANWSFMGAMCIVAAYQLWEDHYRARIAAHVGHELSIPIFGDLRRFRRCIVHNRGRWTNDVGKLECFELEEMDDKSSELVIPRKIMNSIWWKMRLALRDLRKASNSCGGREPSRNRDC
jgi:hypothetical protein